MRRKLFFLMVFGLVAWSNKVVVLPASAATSLSTEPTAPCHALQLNPDDPQSHLPDPTCTPGVIDPHVTQDNLAATICQKGYTKKVRPPVSYTNALKKKQIQLYGYVDTNLKNYEEDHLISLELGGSPRDPQNLWPEPHPSINKKDTIENLLHYRVCQGEMTLAQAQYEIVHNWYDIYQQQHPPTVIDKMKAIFAKFTQWLRKVF